MDDEQAVKLCKAGDKKAFEELIGRYYMPLNRFFLKFSVDRRTCEDLTHDVIVKLIEKIDRYHPISSIKFSAWLYKIAYNTFIDHCNKNTHVKEITFDDIIQDISSEEDIFASTVKSMDREALRAKLGKLPVEMRSLLVLRYYNDFSYAEIGKVMGISAKKVKWKLHNSMEYLRKAYNDEREVLTGERKRR